MHAEAGQAGGCLLRSPFAREASAGLRRLPQVSGAMMARGGIAVLFALATALAGPALGDTVKPVWSDNEDGRANLFMGPQPDYANSLAAEYAIGQGTANTLKRGDVDGIPSTVWLTDGLGTGAKDLRWRWVVDGVPQSWSGTSEVNVTARPLARSNTIDAFGDGSVKLTLDGTYEVGRFEDGEWYAVAPQGLKITHATPAQTGSGESLRNGASVDLDFKDHGLDGRGRGFDQARVAGLNEKIDPGSVLVKVMSQPDGKRNSHIDHMMTLTVLSERPPAGSFRPTVYENGGRALRNEAEIDLDRVPRIDYDPRSFPSVAAIQNWRSKQLTRPAPPLGDGDEGARHLYPEGQASAYHRTLRQDLTLPAHIIMASNLADEGERMALAKALVQREIDILGAFASRRATGATGSAPPYFVAPTVFAGTLLRDPEMRGATALGLAAGDWNFGGRGDWKYSSWADNEAFTALSAAERKGVQKHRDLNRAGYDMTKDGVQVWAPVLEERRVELNPRIEDAENLEALGITYNGDGTWTIPAGRFTDGGLYTWSIHPGPRLGETRLIDPDWSRNTGNEAWWHRGTRPGKNDAYVAQHAVQAVTMAPILKAVAGEDYLANGTSISGATAWELFSGYAQQWMRQSPEWMAALGFKLHNSYPYQRGDGTTSGTNDQRKGVGTGFIDTAYFARWDDYAPVFDPTAPDPATRQMFTLSGTETGFEFRLDDIPHDGWSRLTDIEIRIDDGDWLSTGIEQIGQTYAHDITSGAYLVAMRAVNALGAGAASGTQQVSAGSVSTTPAGGSGLAPSRPSRVAPDSALLITASARMSVDFLQRVAPVPVPPSLALLLGALGAVAVASVRRTRRGC
jgi:hypothetical protein